MFMLDHIVCEWSFNFIALVPNSGHFISNVRLISTPYVNFFIVPVGPTYSSKQACNVFLFLSALRFFLNSGVELGKKTP